MNADILVSLIAAAGALIGVLIKDVVMHLWNRAYEARQEKDRVLKAYAEPLLLAAEAVVWRLKEIIVDRRNYYLRKKYPVNSFAEYKRVSTIYRLGCLLGWMRAVERELARLPVGDTDDTKKLSAKIAEVRSAFADGSHLEVERARRLFELWRISPLPGEEKIISVGVEIEFIVDSFLDEHKHIDDLMLLTSLDKEKKLELCRRIVKSIEALLHIPTVSDGVLGETLERAIESISFKECWIYRDWQNALGDSFLERVNGQTRNFEIIGFEKFLRILYDDTKDVWLERLESMFTGLDLSMSNDRDARVGQLYVLAEAISSLLIFISQKRKDMVSSQTLLVADELRTHRAR